MERMTQEEFNSEVVGSLKRQNENLRDQTHRIAALEVLVIGLLRTIRENPDATLDIERTLADFAKGDAAESTKEPILTIARSYLSAAYEP